jgi:hypothetical protein
MKKSTWQNILIAIVIIIFLTAVGIYGYFKFFSGGSSENVNIAQPVKEGPKYVKLEDVKLHLDCDNDLENEEKAKLFKTKYQGTRLIFSEMVQDKRTNTEYVLNGWLNENSSISKFNCLPHVVLSGDNKIPVEEDKTYEFDCRVADFCEEGTVFDGEIRFDDCKVLKQVK